MEWIYRRGGKFRTNRLSKLTLLVLSAVVWLENLLILRWIKIKSAYTGLWNQASTQTHVFNEEVPTPNEPFYFGLTLLLLAEPYSTPPDCFQIPRTTRATRQQFIIFAHQWRLLQLPLHATPTRNDVVGTFLAAREALSAATICSAEIKTFNLLLIN